MIAAAEGHGRAEDLACYRPLRFDIRIDRPGELLVDYTVGGGRPAHLTVPIFRRPSPRRTGTMPPPPLPHRRGSPSRCPVRTKPLQAVRSALLAPTGPRTDAAPALPTARWSSPRSTTAGTG
ncbi:hypothetical protein K7G98_18880 [Saccharothrix sp. MB29]|nr:hypothetical protein [Saccharothrix sp. MB29]